MTPSAWLMAMACGFLIAAGLVLPFWGWIERKHYQAMAAQRLAAQTRLDAVQKSYDDLFARYLESFASQKKFYNKIADMMNQHLDLLNEEYKELKA